MMRAIDARGPISSEEYERLGAEGLLPSAGVELIHGRIRKMSPRGDRHGFVVSELNRILSRQAVLPYRVYCEALSLQALPGSTPDPDIALARLVRSYARRRPQPSEIALVIEVADSSYAYDVGRKKAIYAAAGIFEYWVFDIRAGRDIVRCFAQPEDDEYTSTYDRAPGDTLTPREFPNVTIDVSAALGLDNAEPDDEAE